MKRPASLAVGMALLLLLAGGALAFMGPHGGQMGMGGPMMMGTGPGMGHGAGMAACPGMAGTNAGTQPAMTEERAKEVAHEYADKHLNGFTVEKVLPITGRHMTMYSVELKGPNDEVRVLHINPFGTVMPFGGPWRRGA